MPIATIQLNTDKVIKRMLDVLLPDGYTAFAYI